MYLWKISVFLTLFAVANQQADGFSLDGLMDDIEVRSTEGQELKDALSVLSRQIMMQGFAAEEHARNEGASGVKQIRQTHQGSKTYHATSYAGTRVLAVHDHSNNKDTVGMGEFMAVLNGVTFATRHNDYKLLQPHPTLTDYQETVPLTYPEVPQSVKDKSTVPEQIDEMREYFKAWRDNNPAHRDFRPHFKSVICYLEGAWTLSDNQDIDESFDSDRHHLDATSWFDLQEKVRFTAYTGRKDPLENFAYLPTTIFSSEDGTNQYAQWNHRILCSPIQMDLHPSRLRLMDDLHARMAQGLTLDEYAQTRSGRFQMGQFDVADWDDEETQYGLLDQIMETVPGLDNYAGVLYDEAYGDTAQHIVKNEKLNAAYYHHWFRNSTDKYMRGFADEHLYMAMNSQSKIPKTKLKLCDENDVCTEYNQRWSYAIPLEIIYLTPLWNWNPYNIAYKEDDEASSVTANGRNGGSEEGQAYDGTSLRLYYRTPADFFGNADEQSTDPADTTKGITYVLGGDGTAKAVVESGIRIILPEIPGVGALRTRYPIVPTHQEGSAIWKELQALKDIVLNPLSRLDMYYEAFPSGSFTTPPPPSVDEGLTVYQMSPYSSTLGEHMHYVTLTDAQREIMDNDADATVAVTTTSSWRHQHDLVLRQRESGDYEYVSCDGRMRCWDYHPTAVKLVK